MAWAALNFFWEPFVKGLLAEAVPGLTRGRLQGLLAFPLFFFLVLLYQADHLLLHFLAPLLQAGNLAPERRLSS